ncbi:hypothetical protein EPUS_07955 [Endocarpon pusillum Z07020]|uniref:BTB domain-containing protein n=1 Tax=Endocarpon pusillum (strain Z07020 / HMAS-L-300199) TaxID=1263415 RepID=U1I4K4_ENDPU|nr:uncharacterized protein EPUS_07955 [Endocarpon pusillum Z07020]ERF77049.1 hypothetical protein EPUS_07955 [Endocarpon pusillum Z07020]
MSRPPKRPAALDSNLRQLMSRRGVMMPSNHRLGSYSGLPALNKKNDIAAVDQSAGASSEPPRKRLRFAEDAVTGIVGSEKVSFTVHQRLLCDASKFFKDALSGGFKEATKKQVRLPDVTPTSFESFLSWLYSSFPGQTHMIEELKTSVPYLCWSLALQLYTLAHYLQCPAFGNNVITCIRTRLDDDLPITEPNAQQITDIYSQTLGDCGLRRLIVLMHTIVPSDEALLSTAEQISAWIENVPAEFTRNLNVRLMIENVRWVSGFWAQGWVVERVEDDEVGYSVENNDLGKPAAH